MATLMSNNLRNDIIELLMRPLLGIRLSSLNYCKNGVANQTRGYDAEPELALNIYFCYPWQ